MDHLSDEEFSLLVDKDLADDLDSEATDRLRQPHNLDRWMHVLLDVHARVGRRADDVFQRMIATRQEEPELLHEHLDAFRRTIRMERKVTRRLIEVLVLMHSSTKTQ